MPDPARSPGAPPVRAHCARDEAQCNLCGPHLVAVGAVRQSGACSDLCVEVSWVPRVGAMNVGASGQRRVGMVVGLGGGCRVKRMVVPRVVVVVERLMVSTRYAC